MTGLACAAGATSASAATVRTMVGTIRVMRNIWLSSSGNEQMCTGTGPGRIYFLGG